MELRHLRYFVAVAEEGSVTVAAEKRLHTAQPSLSRQLRDLEAEVGVPLFTRSARGVELTPAGHAFLDHARMAIQEAAQAVAAARRAARPPKAEFSVGFLTGLEVDWLPQVTQILRAELPKIDFKVSSRHSPDLAEAVQNGELDAALLRLEPQPDVSYEVIAKEPLVVVLPSDHPLAVQPSINPRQLEDEVFVGFTDVPHILRDIVDGYLKQHGVTITPTHRIDNFAVGLSLVASTRGVAILPAYVEPLLPWSVVSRPLSGEPPTIDLAVGYRSDNLSPVLEVLLAGVDRLRGEGPMGQRTSR